MGNVVQEDLRAEMFPRVPYRAFQWGKKKKKKSLVRTLNDNEQFIQSYYDFKYASQTIITL